MNKIGLLSVFKPTFMGRYSFRTFGILEDMESKL
jgi:hypothetical protein